MNKLWFSIPILLLVGCASHEPLPPEKPMIYHPYVPPNPSNPGLKIRVITTDTIEPNKAYVGFEYNDWIEFSKWMHQFKQVNHQLRDVVHDYKEQLK